MPSRSPLSIAFVLCMFVGCAGKLAIQDDVLPADGGRKADAGRTSELVPTDARIDVAPPQPPKADAGPDDTKCWNKQDFDSCADCCTDNHSEGYATYFASAVACVCAADVCGAACSSTLCRKNPANPNADCNDCLTDKYADSCDVVVSTACQASPDCVALMNCEQKCN